jgi:hypothetical protein
MPTRKSQKVTRSPNSNNISHSSSSSSPPLPKSIISHNPIQQNNISQSPTMFDSIKQGFGFGVGSSIGNKIVNSVFNSKDKQDTDTTENSVKLVNETNSTTDDVFKLYNKCLEEKDNSIECNNILEKK